MARDETDPTHGLGTLILTGTVPTSQRITHGVGLPNGATEGVQINDGAPVTFVGTLVNTIVNNVVGNRDQVENPNGDAITGGSWEWETTSRNFSWFTANSVNSVVIVEVTVEHLEDFDGDGIPNICDLDSDNDGLTDLVEGGSDPSIVDTNGDGVYDAPVDANGVPTTANGGVTPPDTDGDGDPDFLDLDSNNDGTPDAPAAPDADLDGIPDALEMGSDPANPIDTDGDGTPDYLDTDSDNDGIPDAVEAGANPAAPVDTDSDGIPDFQDLDSDNDGLTDVEESGGLDTDNDGLLDAGQPLTTTAVDTDGDGIPDNLDIDSDNDGVNDIASSPNAALDADGDGVIDVITDTDSDGIPDNVDSSAGFGLTSVPDADQDGIPDALEIGPDPANPIDTDGDGTPDYLDTDSDNDGIPDALEAGANPANPVDTDGDGTPDFQDTDSDNDGIPDSVEAGVNPTNPVDTDLDGVPDYLDLDSDNDGLTDVEESGGVDADMDGLLDTGLPLTTTVVDTDGDGIPDNLDIDSDNDGVNDIAGTPNAALDADGDGVIDVITDTDGDGIPDNVDTATTFGLTPIPDADMDGIPDALEIGADPANPIDTDGDGTPDYLDTDSDNDGIPDALEAGANPANPVDTDGDGVPDHQDLDSDNDGLNDVEESGGADVDGDGLLDLGAPLTTALVDTDSDGFPDYQDVDSDNDGVNDIAGTANAALDADGDGAIDDTTDVDGDGIPDIVDGLIGQPGTATADFDGDGIVDAIDLDDDNDGIPDTQEGDGTIDTDGDGMPDSMDLDSDGDGLTDAFEADPTNNFDTDGDGIVDNFADTDGDGLNDTTSPNMVPVDSDGDGMPNFQDLNSDNDLFTDAIEDGDFDGNGIHDSIESGCDSCLDTDSGGSFGWLFLMGLFTLLMMRVHQFRKASLALVSLVSLSVATTNVAATDCGSTEEDFEGCLYGTVGITYSELEPDGVTSGYFTDGDNDTGFNIGIGWQFAPNWFAEINYADLGEATLNNFNPNVTGTESVGYQTLSAVVGYQFGNIENNWRPYVRAGIAAVDIDLSEPGLCNDGTHAQLTGGIGIEYQPDNSNFFARGGADWFSSDAVAYGLTIGAYFGGRTIAAKPAPVSAPVAVAPTPAPVVEVAPEVVAAPEPVSNCPVGEVLDINFETNKAVISSSSFPALNDLAATSSSCADTFVIEGHTDSRGSEAYNQELSQRRAQAVVEYLIQRGVDSNQLRAIGYGELRPIGDNSTAEGRLMNRRIEVNIDENR